MDLTASNRGRGSGPVSPGLEYPTENAGSIRGPPRRPRHRALTDRARIYLSTPTDLRAARALRRPRPGRRRPRDATVTDTPGAPSTRRRPPTARLTSEEQDRSPSAASASCKLAGQRGTRTPSAVHGVALPQGGASAPGSRNGRPRPASRQVSGLQWGPRRAPTPAPRR